MSRIRHLPLLLSGLLCSTAASAGTALPAPPPGTLRHITNALVRADVTSLARLYQKPPGPVTRMLAAMALERIHFHLGRASHDARVCERSLLDSQPRIALFCARLAVGDVALARGNRAAEQAEAAMLERFRGHLPASALAGMRRYVARHADLPAFRVDRPAHGMRIALRHVPGLGGLALMVRANGQATRVTVDTGASYMIVSPAEARRLGVRLLARRGRTGGIISHDVPVTEGVLDTLRIGSATAHAVPVEVIANRTRLIGIELLRRLGPFRLSRHALTVYGDDDALPACRQPLLVGSGIWGSAVRVVKALSIDGHLQSTLLDSGSAFYLVGDHASMAQLHAYRNQRIRLRDIGPLLHHARMDRARANVVLGGRPFELTFGVLRDTHLPWHFVLGNGAFEDMDFFIDFDHRHSCLLLHPDLR